MRRSLERQIETGSNPRQTEVAALGPWFHNLHLPDGTETAPAHFLGDFPRYKWRVLSPHLPARLDGWTALDIGCNAGYYSFELARRGAQVTGIDVDSHYLKQAQWAAKEFGLDGAVEFRELQVYDLAREAKQVDLVLFMGVFYHLRYPLLGLDIVARHTRRLMVFQTLTIPGMEVYADTSDHPLDERDALRNPGWPHLAFIEHRFAGDPTNWWVPNHAAVEAMLRSSGMEVRAHLGHEIYLCEPAAPGALSRAPYDFSAELRSATGRGPR
ncbi:MAG: TIGR04290 family methyltransferase [Gemmatimonadales bacterium]